MNAGDTIPNPIEFQQQLGSRGSKKFRVVRPIDYRGRMREAGQTVALHDRDAKGHLAAGRIVALPKPNFIDVLMADLRLPDRVVILGSGPNGKDGYDAIGDAFVIALNAAIDCPVDVDVWMAMDPSLHDQQYFRDAMLKIYKEQYLAGVDYTTAGIGKGYPVPIMEKERVAKFFPWIQLVFKLVLRDGMTKNDVEPHEGSLRPGCTIAGAAVQLAYWCGSKEIRLCGIDMFGGTYFDGSRHRTTSRKEKSWGVVGKFNALMRHLEGKGLTFGTLSRTVLQVDPIT